MEYLELIKGDIFTPLLGQLKIIEDITKEE